MKIVTLFPTAVTYKEIAGEVALANTSIKYLHKEKKMSYFIFSISINILLVCSGYTLSTFY